MASLLCQLSYNESSDPADRPSKSSAHLQKGSAPPTLPALIFVPGVAALAALKAGGEPRFY